MPTDFCWQICQHLPPVVARHFLSISYAYALFATLATTLTKVEKKRHLGAFSALSETFSKVVARVASPPPPVHEVLRKTCTPKLKGAT